MGAQSVTGKGQGESHGKFKPENNAGCGHCSPKKCQEPEPEVKVKRGCYLRTLSGKITATITPSSATSLKVC